MDRRLIVLLENPTLKSGRDRISGVLRYAAQRPDWSVQLVTRLNRLRQVLTLFGRVAGIIGWPSTLVSSGFFTRRQFRRIPIVTNDFQPSARHSFAPDIAINIDNAEIAREAIRFLISRGVRHLAYVGNDRLAAESFVDTLHSQFREAAARKAAQAANCESFAAYRGNPRHDWAKDLERMADWLSHLPSPCGVLAFNDKIAQKVVDACSLVHLSVPEHIRLIGIDNEVDVCENLRPTLTSIMPDFINCGYLAAQALDGILANGRAASPQTITYGVHSVVERASTQDVKGSARIVATASEYIRVHASERIDIDNVAKHLNLNRRTLELRFAEILNTTPGAVLRQHRLENVRRQLLATTLSAEKIASASGFASSAHLKRLFKRTYGQTPGEYRRVQNRPASRV